MVRVKSAFDIAAQEVVVAADGSALSGDPSPEDVFTQSGAQDQSASRKQRRSVLGEKSFNVPRDDHVTNGE